MRQRLKTVAAGVAVSLWGLGAAAGLFLLSRYEHTPGPVAAAAGVWPAGSVLSRDRDRPTLVMSLHPQCPCSHASVEELDRIMARCGTRVSARVLAVLPPGAPPGFAETALVRAARAIPGARVIEDPGGTESRRFGAETSGHVCLYAADGRLLFSGGVTDSRGHAGDSVGADAVVAQVGGGTAGTRRTAVFGCPLTDVQEAPTTCQR